MSGHGQFCPVAVASEVFAHRWTPLIVRELAHGPAAFNDLHRGMPRISRTLRPTMFDSLVPNKRCM